MGRVVGVNGEVVAPSELQEYLGAVGLNSMDDVRAMGRRRRIVVADVNVSEEAILMYRGARSLSLFSSAQI